MDFVSYKLKALSRHHISWSNVALYTLPISIIVEFEVPYRVAVRARTSKGFGESIAIVMFSKEGGMHILD